MEKFSDVVTGVHLYPIKSHPEATVDGLLPNELTIGLRGFEYKAVVDRGWVVADASDLFVSQRGWDEKHKRQHRDDRLLATMRVDIHHDHLVVGNADFGSLQVPLDTEGTRQGTIKIFGPDLPIIDEGDAAAKFYSDFLGRAVRLVKADPNRPRMLPEKYRRPDAANQSAGADGRPFSLASQASLDFLHQRKGWPIERVPINRYRANIVIDGQRIGPFTEDEVKIWRIGQRAVFYEVKSLSRCPITNIDQSTGDDSERLSNELLIPFRFGWAVGDEDGRAEPHFAQSLNHRLSSVGSIVAIGDTVSIIERGLPNFILKGQKI